MYVQKESVHVVFFASNYIYMFIFNYYHYYYCYY